MIIFRGFNFFGIFTFFVLLLNPISVDSSNTVFLANANIPPILL
ncbi:hypothetical protein T643_A2402 [Klebsiella pneumoniae MRSN 1319]|nr:hypothetical protein T643_A2402 [Klebsiella pneumoniae MRSN 1319]